MGLNDDRLSDREHSELRDTILAGTQRIRPAGAHRAQLIAGAVALVLVGGITGGAVTTAALWNSATETPPTSSPTPTPSVTTEPSPTTTPTPTLTPEPEPNPGGVMPFGGECANVLDDEEVDAVTGIDMIRSDSRWETGENAVRGGINCLWVSEGAYLAATAHVFAYPEGNIPEGVLQVADGCVEVAGDSNQLACTASRVVNGSRIQVRVTGDSAAVTGSGAAQLLAAVADRFDDYPEPAPATPTSEWWALLNCNDLVAQIDPAIYGYERVTLAEYPGDLGGEPGRQHSCDLSFTSGSGESTSGEAVWVGIVPGGAISFQTAVDAEYSQPATVEGAVAAVNAPGLETFDGSANILVVTDGVNILMVSPNSPREDTYTTRLAAALLAMMHP